MNRGAQYGNKYRWLHDERFLKDLEGDSVDSEILEDELRSLQYDGPATCRTRLGKVLESNPLQVVLCVLVLIDAGIVVAEMLLDLHSIRGEMRETQQDVKLLLKFVRTEYFRELGGYQGTNITEILTRIKTYQLKASNHSSGIYSDSYVSEEEFPDDLFDQEIQQTAEFLVAADDRFKRSSEVTIDHSGGSRTSDDDSASAESVSKLQPQIRFPQLVPNSDGDNLAKNTRLPESKNLTIDIYDTRQQPVDDTAADRGDIFRKLSSAHKSDGVYNFPNATERRMKRGVTKTSQDVEDAGNKCVCFHGNATIDTRHGDHHAKSQSQLLHEIAHGLHFCSIAILGIFVLQVLLRVVALDLEFFRRKMEIFDAIIIIASFAMDLIFLGGIGGAGEEAAALIILFLLWRILRVVNGILVTAKQRQEFRMKLQKRARRRAERKIEMLQDDKHMKEKEISALKDLCTLNGVCVEDIRSCKPRRVLKRLDTSSGLTSVASLSLSLSMSMSTGIFGNIVSATRRENSPFAKHKSRAANRKSPRDGSLTPRSAQGSLEDLKSRSSENLLSVKPRETFTTIREMDANKDEGVLEPLVGGALCDSIDGSKISSDPAKKNGKSVSKPASPVCDIIVTIDDTGTSVKNDVRPQTPREDVPIIPVTDKTPTTSVQAPTKTSVSDAVSKNSHQTHPQSRSADTTPKSRQKLFAFSQSAGSTPKRGQQTPPLIRSAGSTPKHSPHILVQSKSANVPVKSNIQTPVQKPKLKPPEIKISECSSVTSSPSFQANTQDVSKTLNSQLPGKSSVVTDDTVKSNSVPKSANNLPNNKDFKPDSQTKTEAVSEGGSADKQGPFTAVTISDDPNSNKQSIAQAVASKLTATPLKSHAKSGSSKEDTTTEQVNMLPLKSVVTTAAVPVQNHVSNDKINTPPSQNTEVKDIYAEVKKRDSESDLVPLKPHNVAKVDIPKLANCRDTNGSKVKQSVDTAGKDKSGGAGVSDNKDAYVKTLLPAMKSTQDGGSGRDCSSSQTRSPRLSVRFQNEVDEKIIPSDAPVKSLSRKSKSGGGDGDEKSVVVNCDSV